MDGEAPADPAYAEATDDYEVPVAAVSSASSGVTNAYGFGSASVRGGNYDTDPNIRSEARVTNPYGVGVDDVGAWAATGRPGY